MDWEKIFANDATVEGLISKTNKFIGKMSSNSWLPEMGHYQRTGNWIKPVKEYKCPVIRL